MALAEPGVDLHDLEGATRRLATESAVVVVPAGQHTPLEVHLANLDQLSDLALREIQRLSGSIAVLPRHHGLAEHVEDASRLVERKTDDQELGVVESVG